MKFVMALFSGFLFSTGLFISGMTDPDKVINFLDISGSFDASLIFVMGGALIVSFFAFRFCSTKKSPICESDFCVPTTKGIDKKLIIGSILFGIGWGIGGICPGPALANIATFSQELLIFGMAMILGMFVTRILKWD